MARKKNIRWMSDCNHPRVSRADSFICKNVGGVRGRGLFVPSDSVLHPPAFSMIEFHFL